MENITFNHILSIVSGILTCIPLVYKICEVIRENVKAKQWNQIVSLVTRFMVEAESKFDNGTDRKAYCMAMIEASANTVDCPIDMQKVSDLIDSLCAMSKIVNAPAQEQIEG